MNTQCAKRLLFAAIVSTGLASVALAAGPGSALTEPQSAVAAAGPVPTPDTSPTPDADVNVPNAPDQLFSYYTVSAATMRGRSSTAESTYHSLGCAYLTAGTGLDLILNSDLPLPDGSLIKYLRVYYHDTNAANGVRALLTRYRPGTEAVDLSSVTSTAAFVAGYGTSLSPEITELVDGDMYAYTVIGWPDVASINNRICGVRIAYYGPQFFANGFETPL
jgi:hypothetical protein